MSKKLYILDVSGYIFRAYYAIPPMTNAQGVSTHALFGFIRSVLKLFKDFSPEHMVAVFDGPDSNKQRREIYEEYKATRVQAQPDLPLQIDNAEVFCELAGIPHVEVEGVEADDTMGSIAVWAAEKGFEVYLCSSDKDLSQLVDKNIYVLNTWKDNLVLDSKKVEETFGVPPEKIVDYLAIMGDASDNIPGLYGFGPKTAVELLKEFGTLENILQNPEKIKGAKKQQTVIEGKEIALLSKRLATIDRNIPFTKPHDTFRLKTPDFIPLREFYLEMGFGSLVRELDAEAEKLPEQKKIKQEEKKHYHLVDDEETLDALITLLSQQSEIAFDVEATSVRPILADLVGIGFCFEKGSAYYVPVNGKLGKEKVIAKIKPLFENRKIGFYGHNVKYDIHLLVNEGIAAPHLSFDTILASFILNSHIRRHSLDQLSLHYFGKVKTPIKDLIGTGKKEISMAEVPIDKVSFYCCEDVDDTFHLKELFEKEVKKRKLTDILEMLELPLTLVLAKMERIGVFLDVDHLKEMSEQIVRDIDKLEKEIYAMALEEFNISSPKQLSRILFEKLQIKPLKKTITGHSTSVEVLETLALSHPIAEKIMEYRTLEKLRSTYLETLPLEVNPRTGRIHPTFTQYVAATGRLACQDPNLQNIPVRTPQGRKIREAFRPQKRGWSYLSADYSQIELRFLAHLSEDPNLIKAFKEGEDIHAYTASLVLGIPIEQVTSTQRNQAKAINFGIIYGQQAYGLSQELGIDIREAAAFIEAYFQRYPKVKAFVESCIQQARKTGRSVTMIGREREIPEIHSKNMTIRSAAERLAVNTPLQGSAADLIKMAMLRIDALLTKHGLESLMILQIHDELIFEAPDSEIDQLKTLVKREMESVFALKVPIVVNLTVGKNWGEC